MGYEAAAALIYGVRCKRSLLFKTVTTAGCEHGAAGDQAYCPKCGAKSLAHTEVPIQGFDENKETLTVGKSVFNVLWPDVEKDEVFIGLFNGRTSETVPVIGIDRPFGNGKLDFAQKCDLCAMGLAKMPDDIKLWLILEES
jgi:hypothetical protein